MLVILSAASDRFLTQMSLSAKESYRFTKLKSSRYRLILGMTEPIVSNNVIFLCLSFASLVALILVSDVFRP